MVQQIAAPLVVALVQAEIGHLELVTRVVATSS
jgi:hypothetical protein